MWPLKVNIADLPFRPGTYVIPSSATDAIWNRLGQVYTYPDDRAGFEGQFKTVMVVKNELSSPGAVLPSLTYEFSTTAGEYRKELYQLGSAEATEQYLVDDQLPAAGAPDGAILYVILSGLAYVKTPASASARHVWSIGDCIVGTGSGRAVVASYTGKTESALADQIKNVIGRTMSACTSAEISTLKLVYVGKYT